MDVYAFPTALVVAAMNLLLAALAAVLALWLLGNRSGDLAGSSSDRNRPQPDRLRQRRSHAPTAPAAPRRAATSSARVMPPM